MSGTQMPQQLVLPVMIQVSEDLPCSSDKVSFMTM